MNPFLSDERRPVVSLTEGALSESHFIWRNADLQPFERVYSVNQALGKEGWKLGSNASWPPR